MKKLLFASLALAVLVLVACTHEVPKSEDGTVVSIQYSPSDTVTGAGMSFSGHLAVVSSTTPEHHMVIFDCQHGRFAVDREREWKTLKPGDKVTIYYNEVVDDHGQFYGYTFDHADKK